MEDNNTFITKEGLAKLKKDLEYLKTEKRKEIAERIREAKELGDLSENAEYTEAKEEQAFVEGKIIELEYVIKNSQVIESDKKSDCVRVGSKIKLESENNKIEYIIVGSNESDPGKGKISNESPLGRAFLNKKIGEEVIVEVPQGAKKFKILGIN
ncbi:MAG: transcription elongation factor GreA [Candidatus Kerfeldbacteria bacterium CG_4_10_14_0_8_um_filter_42_10]|uniref:Transcription elongation factor GreA n=1 Tax=Candidatus Kerfeldbacteria bacterium CG_4_10_14_0_8_um_filter_42_10 TaxID=2014248 RepID=A0A2M7RJT5_9BACT|nr:MAG: transcription elongation factor GreA [Candidatus Kerfeldbacteria bacterium CG_4_10_14_0_8_um_filter_42_10]